MKRCPLLVPLLLAIEISLDAEIKPGDTTCDPNCAWYMPDDKECAVFCLAERKADEPKRD
jgi:hypothetical protein